jgi:hypothetical protein
MNSCATPLSERFFRVIIATGIRVWDKSTGSALSIACLWGEPDREAGDDGKIAPARQQLVAHAV